MTARSIVDAWQGQRVVVVGDALLDVWLEGAASTLSREAPVPVVSVDRRTERPGGAANVALNLAALGADVVLVSVVGCDTDGAALVDALRRERVPALGLIQLGTRTTRALHRVVAHGRVVARFDTGTTAALSPMAEEVLLSHVARVLPSAAVLVISDYDHGIFTDRVIASLATLPGGANPIVVVDSKHPTRFRALRPTAVKPNWAETVELLGVAGASADAPRAEGVAAHGEALLDATGAAVVAVTLDADGAVVFERGRPPHRTYASPHSDESATGAGDTFVAALALGLASGAATPTAAELASAAADIVVGKRHTAMCSAHELRARLNDGGKVLSREDVTACVASLRAGGKRIVFTNGCFDILHRGHITYLNRSKALGDVLVVGVNDDDSTRRLKGAGRPVNTLEDRAAVLAALSCVDHITAFSGDDAVDLVGVLRPDVYTKGGDYTIDVLPEASLVRRFGGDVVILPYLDERSTTGILRRIRGDAALPGARVEDERGVDVARRQRGGDLLVPGA